MACSVLIMLFMFLFICDWRLIKSSENNDIVSTFDHNYQVTWGFDHVLPSDQGREIQLSMDKSSGAGFASKLSYGSGFFNLRIKLPDRNSAGVVTAFYLSSQGEKHDELDLEFLGNREGKPYTLQTNVFANGKGDREQRITLLWFDPTADFHTYKILWNRYQIVFFVDDIPIRVLKNNATSGDYHYFPSKPMQIEASLWNGESWATDGGQTKINWTYAPFRAHFQGFDINGCSTHNVDDDGDNNLSPYCDSDDYFWNTRRYRRLNSGQRREYEYVRRTYMNYDYCSDKQRYPTPPLECLNQPY